MAINQKAANVAVARAIPLILLGLIGYSTWVYTKLIGVNYLIRPSPEDFSKPRQGLAAALITIYYLLLLPVLIVYARLMQVIATDPGYVPRGKTWSKEDKQDLEKGSRDHQRRRSSTSRRHGNAPVRPPTAGSGSNDTRGYKYNGSGVDPSNAHAAETGLEDWWMKDVFVSNYDGLPSWCSTCLNYKPDRAHHCREVQRCVRKMDHFCPWVGGIVSETSFKFFIQLVSYAAVYCTYTLVVVAVLVAERHRKTSNYNVHWILVLAFAALFTLFCVGMSGSSIQMAMINVTTIENLSKNTAVWYLAIHIPRPDLLPHATNPNSPPLFRTITFPLNHQTSFRPSTESSTPTPTPTTPTRSFAILESRRGDNPFHLGSYFRNIREVMGYTVLDWLLPLKYSPCADHSSAESAFKLGPAVQRMKEEAGLIPYVREGSETTSSGSQRRRRRKRHSTSRRTFDEEGRRRHRKHRRRREDRGSEMVKSSHGAGGGVLG